MRALPILLILLFAAAVSAYAQAPAQPEAASGFAPQAAVRAPRAMVVTANPHATEAALTVLREGGSAVDAAIAAVLVLNVVEPQSSGIGGGAFLLHFDGRTRALEAWDGRETAPAAVGETLFLQADGKPLGFHDAAVGGRAVGVPGLPALLEAVHRRHGRLAWKRLFEPAIALAQDGFPVSARLHALIARDRFLRDDAAARALFFDAEGAALAVGAALRNPALAGVLRALAGDGARSFYEGPLAADIVAAARREPNPGVLATEDLRAYRVIERKPLCGEYRSYRVCGMPPPSSGGATVLAMLGMLERFRLDRLDPESAFVTHLISEAGRLAYADRDAWYGDPDAMKVRPSQLLDRRYLASRAQLIGLDGSLGVAAPGNPLPGRKRPPPAPDSELRSTTHLSIVDREGNAVALTASIEDAFGSRRMVHGFLLNNQLTDFSFAPYDARGEHPNRVGGGRRPRSSMAPTLVFDPEGALHLVTGSPGGSRIIQYVVSSVVGAIDWKLPVDQVLARAHAGSRNGPTEVEDTPAGRELAARLALFGHEPVLRDMTSGVGLIVRESGGWAGAADPRREGRAAGF